jgi:putative peptidoglycan lipid II flippase
VTRSVLLRSTILVSGLAFLGIVLGFCSQLVIAFYFGATPARDSYFAAAVVPLYLSTLFIGSVGSIFMGSYVRHQTRESPEALQEFVSRTLNVCGFGAVVLSLAGMIWADRIAVLVAPGFPPEQLLLTGGLLRILFPSVAFSVLTALLSTMHQAEGRFVLPGIAPLLSIAVTIIVVLGWGRTIGIASLAYGTLVGGLMATALLVPAIWRHGSYRFLLLPDAEVRRMLVIATPLLLTGIVNRSTGIFERMIASGLDAGSISYLGYANQFLNALSGIAVSGIATTVFPLMSRHWEAGDLPALRHFFLKGLRFIFLITLPVVAFVVVLGESAIRILLERGAFGSEATVAVSRSLVIMMGAFVALSCGSLIAKGFYLTGKTTVFSVIVTTEILIYLATGYLLSGWLSYLGLAIALSVSATYTCVVATIVLRRVFGGLDVRGLLRDAARMTVAAGVGGAVVWILHRWLIPVGIPELASTGVLGVIELIVYGVLIVAVFQLDDAVVMWGRVRNWMHGLVSGGQRS